MHRIGLLSRCWRNQNVIALLCLGDIEFWCFWFYLLEYHQKRKPSRYCVKSQTNFRQPCALSMGEQTYLSTRLDSKGKLEVNDRGYLWCLCWGHESGGSWLFAEMGTDLSQNAGLLDSIRVSQQRNLDINSSIWGVDIFND